VALSVRAVERALDVLLCFTPEEPIQSLTQIAESVRLSKPTVHRLLAALEKKQFISKDQATSQYRLGIHGQCSAFQAQSPSMTIKGESGEIRERKINTPLDGKTLPAYVAATMPKDPQTSTRFNRAGASA
jgi:hypothetical protein